MSDEAGLKFDFSLDNVAQDIAENQSEVQPHVIEAFEREQVELSNAPVDSSGAPFDPSIHSTGADGKGTLTQKGFWKKKRGAKSGGGESTVAQPNTPKAPSSDELSAQAAGIALAQMTIMSGVILGGEEWAPIKDEATGRDEFQMLTDAYKNYCMAKGIKDIPPGVALSFALIAYAAPRFAMPKTQERFGRFKQWIYTKWVSWKAKREERKRARMDNR